MVTNERNREYNIKDYSRFLFVSPFFFLFCLSMFQSCDKLSYFGKKKEEVEKSVKGKVMVKIGDSAVTVEEFRAFLDSLPEFKRIEIMRSPENMTKAVAEFIEAFAILKYAEQRGYFDRPEMKIRRIFVLADLIRPYVFESEVKPYTKVDFADIKKFYDENKELFKHPDVVRLMKIESKSKKELLELRKKIKNVQDFVNIAQSRATPDKFDMGYVAEGDLPPEIAKVVFSMKQGEISPPIKYNNGYAIFAVVDKIEEGYWPLERVIDRVFRAVRKKKVRDRISEITKELVMQLDVFVNFDVIEKELGVKLSREKFEELFIQKIK